MEFASVPLKKIGTRLLGFCRPFCVSYLYIDSYRVSAESRAGEWEHLQRKIVELAR